MPNELATTAEAALEPAHEINPDDPRFTDAWHWQAQFEDGSILNEYNEDGTANAFLDIDQETMTHFILMPNRQGLSPKVFWPKNGSKLVYFRRRAISLDPATMDENGRSTVHCLGIENWETGWRAYCFLFDDGGMVLTDDVDAV